MKISLIISLLSLNETSQTLIDVTEQLSIIDSVYILCPTAIVPPISYASHAKLRRIYTDYFSLTNDLLHKISTECHRYRRFASDDFTAASMMPIATITVSTPTTSRLATDIQTSAKKQEAEFMYSHLAREILISIESNKSEMVEYCRHQYAHNGNQLRLIEEFERSYESHRAIHWYTRDIRLSGKLVQMHQNHTYIKF